MKKKLFTKQEYYIVSKERLYPGSCVYCPAIIVSIVLLLYCLVVYINTNYFPTISKIPTTYSHLSNIKQFEYNQHKAKLYAFPEKLHVKYNTKRHSTFKKSDIAERFVVCYYNAPSEFQDLQPSGIDPKLCTHINIAFASIVNKTIHLDKNLIDTIVKVNKIKESNRDLKVLLSIGGSGADRGYIDMIVNHASRKTFIRSIRDTLKTYWLDGVDLDWEFPGVNDLYEPHTRERQHFSQLLREIRSEYNREHRNYLLTIAAAAPEIIVNAAYDVDQINNYVDFVNIMTYDFHSYTKLTPFTGLNSPLFARANEKYYLATLNINYTVHMYESKGLDRNKMVIGIPTYGHTYALANANNAVIGSPAVGFGKLGGLGFVNYPDVCMFMQTNSNVSIIYDEDAKVPYVYKDTEWVSYDDERSVMEKAKFIKESGVAGAMVYSLNSDDYKGICSVDGQISPFPLSKTIRNILLDTNL